MKKIKRIIKNKYFIISFSVSLILIFLFSALIYVDTESRSTLLGDSSPAAALIQSGDKKELEINAFGLNKQYDLSIIFSIFKAIADFICNIL